jgi:hypothetical protein
MGCLAAGVAFAFAQTLQQEDAKSEVNFEVGTVTGKNFVLKDYRGKYVVLEWWNYDCPVVQRHYRSGNLPSLQKEFREKGVIWAAVNSSAPGKQGHVTAENGLQKMKDTGGNPTEILLDPSGEIGRMFKAKTTPQIVLIGPKGEVLYNGAIDDNPRASVDATKQSENYLRRAWAELSEGKPVSKPRTEPYGCSVKYGD